MREICDRQFLFLSVPAHAWTQITQVALKEYDCIISISLLLWAIAAVLAAHDDAVMAQVLATLVARVPAPVVHELATAPALDRAMLAAVVPHVRRVVVADLADPHLKGAALVAAIWTGSRCNRPQDTCSRSGNTARCSSHISGPNSAPVSRLCRIVRTSRTGPSSPPPAGTA